MQRAPEQVTDPDRAQWEPPSCPAGLQISSVVSALRQRAPVRPEADLLVLSGLWRPVPQPAATRRIFQRSCRLLEAVPATARCNFRARRTILSKQSSAFSSPSRPAPGTQTSARGGTQQSLPDSRLRLVKNGSFQVSAYCE